MYSDLIELSALPAALPAPLPTTLPAPLPTLMAAPTPKSLPEVISGITAWIIGLSFLLASLFLVVGIVRYMGSGGDPSRVEAAKGNVKTALLGYALVALAPVLLGIVESLVYR
jgi:hypothetical protein